MRLVQITTPGGARFTVNEDSAAAFQGFLTDLEKTGYKIDQSQSGGYAVRPNTSNPSIPSEHASGHAIDVNWLLNPRGANTKHNLPENVGEIAAKWGIDWGGNFPGATRDPMHFEYTAQSRNRAMVAKQQQGGKKEEDDPDSPLSIGRAATKPQTAPPAATDTPASKPKDELPADDPLKIGRGHTAPEEKQIVTGGGSGPSIPPDRMPDKFDPEQQKGFFDKAKVFGSSAAQGAINALAPTAIQLARATGVVPEKFTNKVADIVQKSQEDYDRKYGLLGSEYDTSDVAEAGRLTGTAGGVLGALLPVNKLGAGVAGALRAPTVIEAATPAVTAVRTAPSAADLANMTSQERMLAGFGRSDSQQRMLQGFALEPTVVPAGLGARAAAYGVDVASNAAQGAGAAYLTGGDPAAGGVAGAVMTPAAQIVRLLGSNKSVLGKVALDLGGVGLVSRLGELQSTFETFTALYGVDKARQMMVPTVEKVMNATATGINRGGAIPAGAGAGYLNQRWNEEAAQDNNQ